MQQIERMDIAVKVRLAIQSLLCCFALFILYRQFPEVPENVVNSVFFIIVAANWLLWVHLKLPKDLITLICPGFLVSVLIVTLLRSSSSSCGAALRQWWALEDRFSRLDEIGKIALPVVRLAILLTSIVFLPFSFCFGGDFEAFRQVIIEFRDRSMLGEGKGIEMDDVLESRSFWTEFFGEFDYNSLLKLKPEPQLEAALQKANESSDVQERIRERRHNYKIRWPIVCSLVCAWLGSYFYPLDWDEPWQMFPLPNLASALIGNLLGSLAALAT